MGNISPDYISTNYYDPSITIKFENWTGSQLSITISDNEKNVIFSDHLTTNQTSGIRYNLRNLASGKYHVVLENDLRKVFQTIILFDGKIVEKDAVVYNKPIIHIKDNKLKVTFLNSNEKAVVSISNDIGEVYKGKFDVESPFNKIFNVTQLEKGDYVINVSDFHTSKSVNFTR
jgi:hypothetical protein